MEILPGRASVEQLTVRERVRDSGQVLATVAFLRQLSHGGKARQLDYGGKVKLQWRRSLRSVYRARTFLAITRLLQLRIARTHSVDAVIVEQHCASSEFLWSGWIM